MSLTTVMTALRSPEAFALSRLDGPDRPSGSLLSLDDLRDFTALALTASLGVGLYGAAAHAFGGLGDMALHGASAIAAAGIAWTASLPSLYILGSLTGSQLPIRTITLASLITVSFGGLAMLASIPVLWFFEFISPTAGMRLAIVLLSFAGVGLSMCDVFLRLMATLEKARLLHLAWLGLLSVVGAEMFYVFGFFELGW